ncbi:MAG TPA: hypothetical protein VHM66_13065 [Solirubrobacterales bacterium]|nr:hypothetical protein [Solirubrobacterales bacterium]
MAIAGIVCGRRPALELGCHQTDHGRHQADDRRDHSGPDPDDQALKGTDFSANRAEVFVDSSETGIHATPEVIDPIAGATHSPVEIVET